jgi:putative flippase GtrA
MNALDKIFAFGFICIITLFGLCAFALVVFSGLELWSAINPLEMTSLSERFKSILKCIAMLTIAMASFELAHTIVEDEFKSEERLSAPARIRRVLSRFLVVVIVSLAIECLVATFQYVHDEPAMLMQAATIAFGAAALLIAWGVFLHLSRARSE